MNEAKLKNFKNFAKTSKLQQAALTAISVQTSPEDIKDLKNLFMSLDKNGDGRLTIDELKIGLNKRENGSTLLKLLQAADTDNSGEINYTEFIAATLDANIYMREDYLMTAFKMFDTDNSGKIDNEEVVALLSGEELGNLVSKDAIRAAISEIDANGDGEIDFQEFMMMM